MTDTPDKATPTPVDRLSRIVGYVCAGFLIAATAALVVFEGGLDVFRISDLSREPAIWQNYLRSVFPILAFPLVVMGIRAGSRKMRFALFAMLIVLKYSPEAVVFALYSGQIFAPMSISIAAAWISGLACYYGMIAAAAGALGVLAGNSAAAWRWALGFGILLCAVGVLGGGASMLAEDRWSLLPANKWGPYYDGARFLTAAVCCAFAMRTLLGRTTVVRWARWTLITAAVASAVPFLTFVLTAWSVAYIVTVSDLLSWAGSILVDWLALVAFLEMTSPTRN